MADMRIIAPGAMDRAGNLAPEGRNMLGTLYRGFPNAMYDDDTLVLTPGGVTRLGDVKISDVLLSGDGRKTRLSAMSRKSKVPAYEITLDTGTSFIAGPKALLGGFSTDGDVIGRPTTVEYCLERFQDNVRPPRFAMKLPGPSTAWTAKRPRRAAFALGYMACCSVTKHVSGELTLSSMRNDTSVPVMAALREIRTETGAVHGDVKSVQITSRTRQVLSVLFAHADADILLDLTGLSSATALLDVPWMRQGERVAFLAGAATACGSVRKNSYKLTVADKTLAGLIRRTAANAGIKAELTEHGVTLWTARRLVPKGLWVNRVKSMSDAPRCRTLSVRDIRPVGVRDMTCIAPESGVYDYRLACGALAHVTLTASDWLGGYPSDREPGPDPDHRPGS